MRSMVFRSIKGGRLLWSGKLKAGEKVLISIRVKDTSRCAGKVRPVINRVIEYAFWPTERKPVSEFGWLGKGEQADVETTIKEDGYYEILLEADRYAADCEIDIIITFI